MLILALNYYFFVLILAYEFLIVKFWFLIFVRGVHGLVWLAWTPLKQNKPLVQFRECGLTPTLNRMV